METPTSPSAPSAPEPPPSLDFSKLGAFAFGGFGALMLLVAAAMLAEGDLGAATGAGVFGVIFCGIGLLVRRLFRTPDGLRRVEISSHTGSVRDAYGRTGTRTSRTFRYVDADLPDAEVDRLQQQWTQAPWTQRADWAEGRIVHDSAGMLGMLTLFTVLWNVIAVGIAGILFFTADDPPLFVLIFPIIGLALIVYVVRLRIRQRKFGTSIFHLDAVPVEPGGWLRGTVETGVPYRNAPVEGFRVQLACIQRSSYYDTDNERRVREDLLWETETHVHGGRAGGAPTVSLPIDLGLPANQPPTEMTPPDDRILWRLSLHASVPGVDYAAQFEVPVFFRLEARPPRPSAA